MTIRSFLSLTATISIIVLSSTSAIAEPIVQSIPTTQKPNSQLDFNMLLNAFFKADEQATRLALNQNLEIVSSQLGNNLFRAKELGFGTDPKSARIQPKALPFFIFYVGLKNLREFDPGKETSDLLIFTNQLLFPVEIKNKVESSVTIRLLEEHGEMSKTDQPTGWRITRWGRPKLIKQLTEILPPHTQGILVSIPSLNRNFLGYVDDTDLKLVPLASDYLFTKGRPLPAKEAFLKLTPEANNAGDSPR
ncbi:MAG: hypothetical protein E8D52_10985 [Nitrospira sp.]|nr:MAG: hypothetical protein E8D52_10985 [Nitrospira sp.]